MGPEDEDDDRPSFEDAWGEMDEPTRQRLQQQIEDLAGGILAANDRLSGGASTQEVWHDLLDPIVPGGVGGGHVSKAEFERLRRVFDKSFRAAARPYRDAG